MSETVKLYRVENPNIPANPLSEGRGGVTHPDIRGQWYSSSLDKALSYIPKSVKTKDTISRKRIPINGAVLHVAEVPVDQLESYSANHNPVVIENEMDYEPTEDYILPTLPDRTTIPLDEIVGDMRERMGSLMLRPEEKRRIKGALAVYLTMLELPKKLP